MQHIIIESLDLFLFILRKILRYSIVLQVALTVATLDFSAITFLITIEQVFGCDVNCTMIYFASKGMQNLDIIASIKLVVCFILLLFLIYFSHDLVCCNWRVLCSRRERAFSFRVILPRQITTG